MTRPCDSSPIINLIDVTVFPLWQHASIFLLLCLVVGIVVGYITRDLGSVPLRGVRSHCIVDDVPWSPLSLLPLYELKLASPQCRLILLSHNLADGSPSVGVLVKNG